MRSQWENCVDLDPWYYIVLIDWAEGGKSIKVVGGVLQLEKVNAMFRKDLMTEFEWTKKLSLENTRL